VEPPTQPSGVVIEHAPVVEQQAPMNVLLWQKVVEEHAVPEPG